jgi:hypothetical protein
VGEFRDVDGADTAGSKEGGPVVFEVLVENAVPDVVGKEVLYLDGSTKTERDLGVDAVKGDSVSGVVAEKGKDGPKKGIGLVVHGVGLEAERCLLLRLAENRTSWSLDEVLPMEAVVRPAVTEAGCGKEDMSKVEQPREAAYDVRSGRSLMRSW